MIVVRTWNLLRRSGGTGIGGIGLIRRIWFQVRSEMLLKTQRGLRPQPICQRRDSKTQAAEKLVTEKWDKMHLFCDSFFCHAFFVTLALSSAGSSLKIFAGKQEINC